MRIFIVLLAILAPTFRGQTPPLGSTSRPEDLCANKPVINRGDFYALKVSSSFYRRAHPLRVEVYQTVHRYGPIISDVFMHVPETAKNSTTAVLGINTLGYWLPKNPPNYKVANVLSCYNSVWGNDAIVSNSDRELKYNLTGTWYPPTSQFDLRERPFVRFVAYVTPDPDVTRRRWYRAVSRPIRNLDYIALQYLKRRQERMYAQYHQMVTLLGDGFSKK